MPIATKNEVRSNDLLIGDVVACGAYDRLARRWDDTAKKVSIDFKGATFLTMVPEERRAEITIGNGPYYALMDLKDIGSDRTRVISYSRDGMASMVKGWQALIQEAGKCS